MTLKPINYSLYLFAACFIALSTVSFAETIETVETRNYYISPQNPQQIKPELIRHTPIRENGGTYNGHTDWYIDWQYQARQEQTICRIYNIQTKVHVLYTLPALSQFVVDQETIDIFTRFNDALTMHEKNHGQNGLLAAREIDQAILQIEPQRSCRYISRMIDDIGNRIVQKYIFADREYDRLTNNGATEGAVIY